LLDKVQRLQVKIEETILDQRKDDIVIYLLSKGWSNIGFNRIRQNVSDQITDSDILQLIEKYPTIFSLTALKDSDDKNGLRLNDKVSTNILVR